MSWAPGMFSAEGLLIGATDERPSLAYQLHALGLTTSIMARRASGSQTHELSRWPDGSAVGRQRLLSGATMAPWLLSRLASERREPLETTYHVPLLSTVPHL